MDIEMYDVIILGSGPAGLTAALYAGRANKKTIVLGGSTLGGQMSQIAKLENYPGWTGDGMGLAEFMKKQAESFGAKIISASATSVDGDVESGFNIAADDGKRYVGKTVIFAKTITSPPKRYTTAIIGTNFSVTDAKREIPPIKINAAITAKTTPIIQVGIPVAPLTDSPIELD